MKLFNQTVAITDVDLTKYKVIFFVGGHGPMFDLPNSDVMNNAAAKIFENGGIVAGVCHGVVGMFSFTILISIYFQEVDLLIVFFLQLDCLLQLSMVLDHLPSAENKMPDTEISSYFFEFNI